MTKKLLAIILTLTMLMQIVPFVSVSAEGYVAPTLNTEGTEGLWLSELYYYDYDRSLTSVENNITGKDFDSITTFSKNIDYMDYIELVSTYKDSITIKDFTLEYTNNSGTRIFEITDLDGTALGDDVTLGYGQTVVIWNDRGEGTPTAKQFLDDMSISSDVLVLRSTGDDIAGGTYTVKDKNSNIISQYTSTSGIVNGNLSIELQVPDIGYEMLVYRSNIVPTPGSVVFQQFNGILTPDYITGDHNDLIITEIYPCDIDRDDKYTATVNLMECIEVYNNSDSKIDLASEVALKFVVHGAMRRTLKIKSYEYLNNSTITNYCPIEADETAVLWIYRNEELETSFGTSTPPTLQDFRTAHNIDSSVPVYFITNQVNGLDNNRASIEVYNVTDTDQTLVSRYCYLPSEISSGKSVELQTSYNTPQMFTYKTKQAPTMGVVDDAQLQFWGDGSTVAVEVFDDKNTTYLDETKTLADMREDETLNNAVIPVGKVPTSVNQGERIRAVFKTTDTETLPFLTRSAYYRVTSGSTTSNWAKLYDVYNRVHCLYEVIINANDIFDADYVEFYVKSTNLYRTTYSGVHKVDIIKENDVDGVRTNIKNGDIIKGDNVTITANDGSTNSIEKITITNTSTSVITDYNTVPMLENGAYFSYSMSGRDNNYKCGITSTDDEVIANTSSGFCIALENNLTHIDNKYFKPVYDNSNLISYDTTLRFWSGSMGSITVKDDIDEDATRNVFSISDLSLRMVNSTEAITPTEVKFENSESSQTYDSSTSYTIGSTNGNYIEISFSIPVEDVNAVGTTIDTTELNDGAHKLTVSNGTASETVNFTVDNTAPSIDWNLSELTGEITLNPTVTDTNLESYTVTLDGEEIITPYKTTAYELGTEEHTLVCTAYDKAGNSTTFTETFTADDVSITATSSFDNVTDRSAELQLTVTSASTSASTATFYNAKKVAVNDVTPSELGRQPYVQYDITVGEVAETERIILDWTGDVTDANKNHVTQMYVLNTATEEWDKVAIADEDSNITNASFVAKDHVEDGKATVVIQSTTKLASPDFVSDSDTTNSSTDWGTNKKYLTSAPSNYDFAFAWISDPQYYTQDRPDYFIDMNNYIADNAEALKIKYVINVGDLVDDYDYTYQWKRAQNAMNIFAGKNIPYGVLPGNHDDGSAHDIYDYYWKHFGEEYFNKQPYYGESYNNNYGHYDLISEDGEDFIIVYMGWIIDKNAITWMNDVLSEHSDRKAILCFHAYVQGGEVSESASTYLDYWGNAIQEKVVAKNSNVFAVLNGHYHGANYETTMFDDDKNGILDRTVYQICTDFQGNATGGDQYFKLLYFDLDNDKVYMNSYSPSKKDYDYNDTYAGSMVDYNNISTVENGAMHMNKHGRWKDAGIMDVPFNEAITISDTNLTAYVSKEIATVNVNNGTASVRSGYTLLKTNYWFAEVTNEDSGITTTAVQSFETADSHKLGDIDDNAGITVKDATTNQMIAAELITPTEEQIKWGDVDGTGAITVRDATYIQMKLAAFEIPFQIGDPINNQ